MEMQKSNAKNAAGSTEVAADNAAAAAAVRENEKGANGGGTANPVPPATGRFYVASSVAPDDSKVGSHPNRQPSPAARSISSSIPDTIQSERMLLLEDATLETLPDYCIQLFASIDNGTRSSQIDLLVFLIYCVALESGFALPDVLAAVRNDLEPLHWAASSYHARNIRKLAKFSDRLRFDGSNYFYSLSLVLYAGNTAEILCNLTGIQAGDLLVLTLSPDDDSPGRSVSLPVSRYVLAMRLAKVVTRFRNLRELSYELKEHLFVPIRKHVLEVGDNQLYCGLCGIPEEVVFVILSKLDMLHVHRLSATCRKMRELCMAYHDNRLNQISNSTITSSFFSGRVSDM